MDFTVPFIRISSRLRFIPYLPHLRSDKHKHTHTHTHTHTHLYWSTHKYTHIPSSTEILTRNHIAQTHSCAHTIVHLHTLSFGQCGWKTDIFKVINYVLLHWVQVTPASLLKMMNWSLNWLFAASSNLTLFPEQKIRKSWGVCFSKKSALNHLFLPL